MRDSTVLHRDRDRNTQVRLYGGVRYDDYDEVLFHVKCCIRLTASSALSTILYKITIITHNHHTNVHSFINIKIIFMY